MALQSQVSPSVMNAGRLGLLLQYRRTLNRLNTKQRVHCVHSVLALLDDKQLTDVFFFGLHAINLNSDQLFQMKSILNQVVVDSVKNKQKHKCNEDQSTKSPLTANTSNNPHRPNNQITPISYSTIGSIVAPMICGFLENKDIIRFQATNVQNAIAVCGMRARLLAVAVCDMRDYVVNADNLPKHIGTHVSFIRYSPKTQFVDLFESWNRLYGIPTHRQVICDYQPSNDEYTILMVKSIAHQTVSSAKTCDYCFDMHTRQWITAGPNTHSLNLIRFRGPYLIFDAKNITIVTARTAESMDTYDKHAMDVDSISSIPNYSLLMLKYHDVMTDTLDVVDCICISKDVTFSRLFDYIENEYQRNAFTQDVYKQWYDTFKQNVRRLRGNDTAQSRMMCVEFDGQRVPGLHESSPVAVCHYICGLDDNKQVLVFGLNGKAKLWLEKNEMDLDQNMMNCTPKQSDVTENSNHNNHNQKKEIVSETMATNMNQHHTPPKAIKKAATVTHTTSHVPARAKPMNNKAITAPPKLSTVLRINEQHNVDNTNHSFDVVLHGLKPYTFHCDADSNCGLLRLELSKKIASPPKQIEIYEGKEGDTICTWKHKPRPGVHYTWKVVHYDTRIWPRMNDNTNGLNKKKKLKKKYSLTPKAKRSKAKTKANTAPNTAPPLTRSRTKFIWFYVMMMDKKLKMKMMRAQKFKTVKVLLEQKTKKRIKHLIFQKNVIPWNETPNYIMSTFGAKNDDPIDIVYE